MDLTDRDATLIIAALTTFSHDWEQADEEIASEAWELALEIAEDYDLEPGQAVKQLRTK